MAQSVTIEYVGTRFADDADMLFLVKDLDGQELANNLTVEEILQHQDFRVKFMRFPLLSEVSPNEKVNPREFVLKALEVKDALVKLEQEVYSTTNAKRYEELKAPEGPLRTQEMRFNVYSYAARIAFMVSYDIEPGRVRDILT